MLDNSSVLTLTENYNVELNTFGTTIKIIGNKWYWLYEYPLPSTVNNGLKFDRDRFIYSYMLDEKPIINYNLIGDWDYLDSLPYVDDLSRIHDELILDLLYDSWIVDYIPDDYSWYDEDSMDDSIYNGGSFLNSTENSNVKLNTFGTTIILIGHQYHWCHEYDLPPDFNNRVAFDMDKIFNSNYDVPIVD